MKKVFWCQEEYFRNILTRMTNNSSCERCYIFLTGNQAQWSKVMPKLINMFQSESIIFVVTCHGVLPQHFIASNKKVSLFLPVVTTETNSATLTRSTKRERYAQDGRLYVFQGDMEESYFDVEDKAAEVQKEGYSMYIREMLLYDNVRTVTVRGFTQVNTSFTKNVNKNIRIVPLATLHIYGTAVIQKK